MQPVADKPADGDIHQLAVVDDADQEAGKHQSNSALRIDPRSPLFMATALGGSALSQVKSRTRSKRAST